MAKVIMIQGTMSNVGKSFLTAGLCRLFHQDGYRVAPFKSQNMALNSFVTEEGLEMGRAQVVQAEAAGIAPRVCMNPILLKPTSDMGSQVILHGEVVGNMRAREYFQYKKTLVPEIRKAFREVESLADIVVVEGAGSPAEINLKEGDIVNMGLAEILDCPVLLVGDIDRGGVFAQLLGTELLLEDWEKRHLKGMIINKFRGDPTILTPGIRMLEERSSVPVCGVVPYQNIQLEDEDSLTARFESRGAGLVDLAVIRYPRISNFTDFSVFETMEDVSVRFVDRVSTLGNPDLIFLPGSKNTMGDLRWLRESGLEAMLKKQAGRIPIIGICGGFQMLGEGIADPEGVEEGGTMRGLQLLPIETVLQAEKTRRQVNGTLPSLPGALSALSGSVYQGYEIHAGESRFLSGQPLERLPILADGQGGVYGSYIHGIFDGAGLAEALIRSLAERKGIDWLPGRQQDYRAFRERQYDMLADNLRTHLDMKYIYSLLSF